MNQLKYLISLGLTLVWWGFLLPGTGVTQDEADLDRALEKVGAWEFGESRAPLLVVADHVMEVLEDPVERRAISRKLIALLKAENTTTAGKRFLCRQLSLAGDAEAVPALAGLLADEKLSHMARYALHRIPGREGTEALREAVTGLRGALRVGVINSLGDRRDAGAVSVLAEVVCGEEHEAAVAAVQALGKIGGKEAAAILHTALEQTNNRLLFAAAEASLKCADRFLAEKKKSEAVEIYRALFIPGMPLAICKAAFVGLATQEANGFERVPGMLRRGHPALAALAAGLVRDHFPGTRVTKRLADLAPGLCPGRQRLLILALGDRGDAAAHSAALSAAGADDEGLQEAGLKALGTLGSAADIPVLVKAGAGKSNAGKAARRSLHVLRGAEVDPALLLAMSGAEAEEKVVLIEILERRRTPKSMPVLLAAARGNDRKVRKAALEAMGKMGRPAHLKDLIPLLLEVKSSDQKDAQKAVASVCLRIEEKAKQADHVLEALEGADGPGRCTLLPVLSRLGGAKALTVVEASLEDEAVKVQDAAVRTLCDWKDASPVEAVHEIALKSERETHRVLALRGYARMVGMRSKRKTAETIKMYQAGLSAAKRPQEKKLMISGLGKLKELEAMKVIRTYLEDEDLRDEAEAALVRLAESMQRKRDKKVKADAGEILNLVISGTRNEKRKEKALKIARKLNPKKKAVRREVF